MNGRKQGLDPSLRQLCVLLLDVGHPNFSRSGKLLWEQRLMRKLAVSPGTIHVPVARKTFQLKTYR